jgi:hypothetical protein
VLTTCSTPRGWDGGFWSVSLFIVVLAVEQADESLGVSLLHIGRSSRRTAVDQNDSPAREPRCLPMLRASRCPRAA